MAWVIDNAHTLVEFSVKHMMIATVRGRFTGFGGAFDIDDKDVTRSTVEGYIESGSVDTHDEKRDAHLRSADFFDTEKYPTMTFRSTGLTRAGDGRYQVAGLLTIKDVTKPVVFEVTDEGRAKDPWGNLHWGMSASAALNRKEYGLNWNMALEAGGMLVGEQVKIHVELEAIYQPEAPVGAGEPVLEAVAA